MRLRIAICDDEHNQLLYLKSLVERWSGESDVSIFESAEAFKDAFFDDAAFDILLLDIQMNGQNGVELAKELRVRNEKLIIIFITALPDFAAEGYDVEALHYLMKPVDEAKFTRVMDAARERLQKAERCLMLPVEREYVKVATGDVLYAESFAHHVELHLTNGAVLTVKMPINELAARLGDSFIRCHRSYLVGLKHLSKITKSDVVLTCGTAIPLSRRLYNDVNKALIKWITA